MKLRPLVLVLLATALCCADAAQSQEKPASKDQPAQAASSEQTNETQANDHLARGTDFAKQDMLDEAITEFHEALRLKPDSAEAHQQLSDALRKKWDLDGALAEAREAVRLKPGDSAAHRTLGSALRNKGDLDAAIAEYHRALSLDPSNADARSGLGNALRQKHDLDGAISEYREALRLKPDEAVRHADLGSALKAKGDLDAAVAEFREALRLKPDDSNAHHELGLALYDKRDLTAAVGELRVAVALDPTHKWAWNNLGRAYLAQGQLDPAIEAFRKAIEINPREQYAYNNLGLALWRQKKHEEAIEVFRKQIEVNPEDRYAHGNLGRLYVELNRQGEAVPELEKVLSIDPNNRTVRMNLSDAYLKLGQTDKALALADVGWMSFGEGNFGERYGPYIEAVKNRISSNWLLTLISSNILSAPRVYVQFVILREGTISNVQISQSSGVPEVDRAALRAVLASNPVALLPPDYSGDKVSVKFYFDFHRGASPNLPPVTTSAFGAGIGGGERIGNGSGKGGGLRSGEGGETGSGAFSVRGNVTGSSAPAASNEGRLSLNDVPPAVSEGRTSGPSSLTLGDAIKRAAQAAMSGHPTEASPGAGGSSAQFQNYHPNFSSEAPIILSDTMGVDFGPYLGRVVYVVRRNWYQVIPDPARLGEKGRVTIVFEILKDGSVPQLRVVATSGSEPLDRAALAGIRASVPFPRLPEEFKGNRLVLQLIFLYNLGGVPPPPTGGNFTGIIGGTLSSAPPAPGKANVPKRIRVGGQVELAKLIFQPRPEYPPLAKMARTQGTVRLEAIISKDGLIQDLKMMSGHPLLVKAAIEAVSRWRYQRTLLNGEPVEVVTEIDVNFSLGGNQAAPPTVDMARAAEASELGMAKPGEFVKGAFTVGGNVSAPVPIYKPDPPYSEEARKAKIQGTVALSIVVDARGNVSEIHDIRYLGYGLDEKAIETVFTWKFRPGLRDGVPVPVRIPVDIIFRLSSGTGEPVYPARASTSGEGNDPGKEIYSLGGNVTAPVPTYKPTPPYSEEARKAKVQGTVLLGVLVDAQGNVSDVRLLKPLSKGLDEKAIETVRTWKFRPATREGVAVPVRFKIEVAFRLF